MMKQVQGCFLLAAFITAVIAPSTILPTSKPTTASVNSTKTTVVVKTATPKTATPKTATPKTTTLKTTSLSPAEECGKHNKSCSDCLKISKCLYCKSDDTCLLYPSHDILPPSSLCALSDARWGVCWLNFEAMIISVSVIGGVIILAITFCCIYCCCCRGKASKRYVKEDSKFEQQKMERKVKQDERRTERKGKLDEIRKKYGLVKDDAPYQRFDA